MTDRISVLNERIRRCDPGRYLSEAEIAEILDHIPELEREELSGMHGHLGWFYMKIKANAERHNRHFRIPKRWAPLYDAYKADLQIFNLPKPMQFIACLLRNFGLRASFIQGPGSRPEYRLQQLLGLREWRE